MALEKLGPYKFESVLGRGGMGTVYTGRHKDSGELHAVKVLAPTYAHDDHFRGRFESEIKALIKLDHPNIVRLLSFGQEDGNLFFSMELVPGNSLFAIQKKGHKYDWKEILNIAKDVAAGLRHAHDRGIIHRDLKPGNLLMTDKGRVKITDFGIAKAYGSNQNTGENVLGTMDFMSPEQAKGERVTVRSDLYSLGTVLFTLLSGKPPFSANSIEESLRNLTRVPAPRITSVVPNVPRELDLVIAHLMEKKPESRIATAQALLHKLEEVESTLKDYSEAQTAQHPHKKSEETFEFLPENNVSTDSFTHEEITDSTKQFKTKSNSGPPKTVEFTDHDEGSKLGNEGQLDFFNVVSDTQRGSSTEYDESGVDTRGLWPIVAGLITVIALAGVGIYFANKKPTADALYEEIASMEMKPQLALKEMDQFLQWYPDDERLPRVENMNAIGKSIRYFDQLSRKLSVREDIKGESRVTKIEKQFLDIAYQTKTDSAAAYAKMAAFVTVHESVPDLSERDRDCIEAAKAYRHKIRFTARNNAVTDLTSIRAAMDTAAGSEPAKAGEIYRSIIALYDDQENEMSNSEPELKLLVDEAKKLLAEIDQ
jgi:serine/threonine-protein kinase